MQLSDIQTARREPAHHASWLIDRLINSLRTVFSAVVYRDRHSS